MFHEGQMDSPRARLDSALLAPMATQGALMRAKRVEAGQILLIVILVIIISSTVGLSLATRSITSLRTSTEEAESQKALAAAEAGIERAIQGNTPIAIPQVNNPSNNSSYSTQVEQVQSSSFLLNGWSTIQTGPSTPPTIIPNTVPKDEGADVWLVGHNANGTVDYSSALSPNFLNLYWGSTSEVCGTQTAPAAVEAIVVSRDNTGEIKSYRYVYDSCNRGNNFTLAGSGTFTVTGIPGITFTNRTPQSDLAKSVNDIVFIRVVPIYKDAVIAVSACNHNQTPATCTSLPIQGYVISSTGISGAANRKITVFKGYAQTYLPYLSYGLFVANKF